MAAKTQPRRNKPRADAVIDYIEMLPVPSGVGAGNCFEVVPFQSEFMRDIYEPMDEDGDRLARRGILSTAKKNGKTGLIAAIVLAHLDGPEAVLNGEIYVVSGNEAQAAITFQAIVQMIELEPELDANVGGTLTVIESKHRIVNYSNGSIFQVLSRAPDTKHGFKPTLIVYDEAAQSKDRELFDVLDQADARPEFLFLLISTQSKDPTHWFSELIDTALEYPDPRVVVRLYCLPDSALEDQWCETCNKHTSAKKISRKRGKAPCPECGAEMLPSYFDPALWPLANPALGYFLPMKSMEAKAEDARKMNSFRNSFCNLRLNMRVSGGETMIAREDWEACEEKGLELEPGEDIYLGLDLSAKNDLTALVAVSAENGDRLQAWAWKPESLLYEHEKRDRIPYRNLVEEGYLFAPPGRSIKYEFIMQHIVDLSSDYNILGIAFDRWRIDDLLTAFERYGVAAYKASKRKKESNQYAPEPDGFRFIEWGQGFYDMTPAIEAFCHSVDERILKHPGHTLLTWCMSNTKVIPDHADGKRLDKEKTRFRIDLAVAATMAVGLKARYMLQDDDNFDEFLAHPIKAAS